MSHGSKLEQFLLPEPNWEPEMTSAHIGTQHGGDDVPAEHEGRRLFGLAELSNQLPIQVQPDIPRQSK
jgi:hypothetical protein